MEKRAFFDSFNRIFRKHTQSKSNPAAEKFTIDRNHKRTLQRAMKHNKQEGSTNRSFVIDYKKLNGDVVKRKIDPLEMRNNVVIAFDHQRDALRSFKVERINSMVKAGSKKHVESMMLRAAQRMARAGKSQNAALDEAMSMSKNELYKFLNMRPVAKKAPVKNPFTGTKAVPGVKVAFWEGFQKEAKRTIGKDKK